MPARPTPVRLPFGAALTLILAAAAWLHADALRSAFFADDYLFLDQVRDRSLGAALQAPDPLSNFLRPLSRQVWFWCVAGLSNESPFAFRAGNLAWVLVGIAAFAGLVRRVANERAALIAAGILALHYSADVAVRWASGSQDAMAVAFALVALWAYVAERRALAAGALFAALLCKEVVLFAPLVGVLLDRRPREPWSAALRRAWPLALAVVAYGALSLLVPRSRQAAQYEMTFDFVQGPLAALAHLPQVALGLEWVRGRGLHLVAPPWGPLAVVLVAMAFGADVARADARRDAPLLLAGVAWALVATAPIAAVAHLWSAYYYLFAMAGLALALGAMLARRGFAAALPVVALLAFGSAIGRQVPGFTAPRDRWSTTSHVNREHIESANRVAASYTASLLRRHPRPEPGTSFFFAGVQGAVAFQRADGPLLRWAYRDTSLRGWYHSQLTHERLARGPAVFMAAQGDSLVDLEPGADLLLRVGFGLAVSDARPSARVAFESHLRGTPSDTRARRWLAWTALADGDTAARRALLSAQASGADTPFAGRDAVLHALAAGDTTSALDLATRGATAHPLDAAAQGLLADLHLIRDPASVDGTMLALGARALAPDDPFAWRRWGMVQLQRGRVLEAAQSLERYVRLANGAPEDTEAHRMLEGLRRSIGDASTLTVGG